MPTLDQPRYGIAKRLNTRGRYKMNRDTLEEEIKKAKEAANNVEFGSEVYFRTSTKFNCMHDISKLSCRECHPALVCEQDRRKSNCKNCTFINRFNDFVFVMNAVREARGEEPISKDNSLNKEFLEAANKIKYRKYGFKD